MFLFYFEYYVILIVEAKKQGTSRLKSPAMLVFLKREDAAGGGSHARAHARDSAGNSIPITFRVYF